MYHPRFLFQCGKEKFHNLFKELLEGKKALDQGKQAGDKYYLGLSKITTAAKDVFGSHITEDFVQENLDLFLALLNPRLKQLYLTMEQLKPV